MIRVKPMLAAIAATVAISAAMLPSSASASTETSSSRATSNILAKAPNASGGGCTSQSDWGGWTISACLSDNGGIVVPDMYVTHIGVVVPRCSVRLDLEYYNLLFGWQVNSSNSFSCSTGHRVGSLQWAGFLNTWRTRAYVVNGNTGNSALVATSPELNT